MQLVLEHALTSKAMRAVNAGQNRTSTPPMAMHTPSIRSTNLATRQGVSVGSGHRTRVMQPLSAAQAEAATAQQTTDDVC